MSPVPLSIPAIIGKARETEVYLGDPNLPNLVSYTTGKYGNILVLKSSLTEEQPTPAAITFFGEVSRSGCFVKPYGAYSPGKFENTSIDKAKIRMQIRNISHPKYRGLLNEWPTYLSNLHAIHRLNYAHNVPKISTPIKSDEICISHDLFEKIVKQESPISDEENPTTTHNGPDIPSPKENNDSASDSGDDIRVASELTTSQNTENTDDDVEAQDNAVPNPFTIDGWPVVGPWREEMMQMRDNIRLMPLVLYNGIDDTAEPLGPHEYESRLPGSIVKVVVSFESFKFTQHNLAAHVEEIRILAPPPTFAPSPSKRRFNSLVSQGKSPKKSKLA